MDRGVYAIVSRESGKVYVGSTVNLKKRWGQHCGALRYGKHNNPHLQRAWNLYGESAFEFGVLEYVDNPEELHLAEQFWMDIYREEGIELYNYGLAARHPMLGIRRSEETLRKMSKALMGCKLSEEHRANLSEAHKGQIPWTAGHHRSEEAKRKMSKANSGRNHPNWGKHHSEETCRKIARASAKPYPAFMNRDTGEIIPAGVNLKSMCQERKLNYRCMWRVGTGERNHHEGWMLLEVLL